MKVEQRVNTTPNGVVHVDTGYFFADCALTLEDLPPQQQKGPVIFPTVHLDNGVVIYRGGPLAEGNDAFIVNNCRFDIGASAVPPPPVQDLLEAALKQGDLQRLEVNLPGGKPA
jgi:hypothetical protein